MWIFSKLLPEQKAAIEKIEALAATVKGERKKWKALPVGELQAFWDGEATYLQEHERICVKNLRVVCLRTFSEFDGGFDRAIKVVKRRKPDAKEELHRIGERLEQTYQTALHDEATKSLRQVYEALIKGKHRVAKALREIGPAAERRDQEWFAAHGLEYSEEIAADLEGFGRGIKPQRRRRPAGTFLGCVQLASETAKTVRSSVEEYRRMEEEFARTSIWN